MTARATIVGIVLLLTGLALPEQATAGVLERLIMPGKVISGHAEFEDQCDQCHGDDDLQQAQLCTGCHKKVGTDISSESGYHGLDPNARGAQCVVCHTEHEGRDADIVSLNTNGFDHALTNFALRGAHVVTACAQCHEPAVAWHEAPTMCINCHQEDDQHQGSLGPQCGDCHTEVDWVQTQFDHGQTGFPLIGKHRDTSCTACHQGDDYSAAPTRCSACHAKQDVHAGVAGDRCESCHSSFAWTTTRFDHSAVSDFTLGGGHANLTCQACHKSPNLADLEGAQCLACHGSDDVHVGKNGTQCADCHSVRKWDDIKFDHQVVANFALLGAHAKLVCESCHQGDLSAPLEQTCNGCHGGSDDPHRGELGGNCESCHNNNSWTEGVRFDHDLGLFPLLGMHTDLTCDKCHASAAFHEADAACISCHQQGDAHQGQLGDVCSQCHNPFDWGRVDFDHSQTRFELTGAHSTVACDTCHRSATTEPESAPLVCGQCHQREDTHSGRFGNDCGRCHTTRSFDDIREL